MKKAGLGEMPVVNAVPAVQAADAGVPVQAAETEEPAGELPGKKPEYNVVQPEVTREGKTIFKSVGALWKNVSKSGQEFYTLKIGKLRLLVFQNREPRRAAIFSAAPEERGQ